MNRPFTAALIAGGKSSRMGTDKRLIEIGGEPLWQRQLAVLQELKPAELLISGEPHPRWPHYVKVIPDAKPGQGPLGALHALLSAASCDRLLVLAVDLPRMTSTLLATLLDATDAPGIVPSRDGRFEPLCAVYPRTCAPLAATLLREGDLSMHALVQNAIRANLLRPLQIAPHQTPLLTNLNTPADLRDLRLTSR